MQNETIPDGCHACGALPCDWVDNPGWRPIETAPRDGDPFLATTLVKHIGGGQWWEIHLIWADDETGEVHQDCERGWSSIDDYFYWLPLPSAPTVGEGR